jgi:hypothetical protein
LIVPTALNSVRMAAGQLAAMRATVADLFADL